jgi:hypothetical protein
MRQGDVREANARQARVRETGALTESVHPVVVGQLGSRQATMPAVVQRVDCDDCRGRGRRCADCVMTVILGRPPVDPALDAAAHPGAAHPGADDPATDHLDVDHLDVDHLDVDHLDQGDLDEGDRAALRVLTEAGLLAPTALASVAVRPLTRPADPSSS